MRALIARDYTRHCAVFRPLQRACRFPRVSGKSSVFLRLEINGRSIQLSSYARQTLPPSLAQRTQTILFVPTSKYYNNNMSSDLKAVVYRD
jgi:hypothetical protein